MKDQAAQPVPPLLPEIRFTLYGELLFKKITESYP